MCATDKMPGDTAPVLSVVIVSWNTRELLSKCLDSFVRHPPPVLFEVIVVDNASSDGSADTVATQFPWVTLVRSDRNTGYAAGNNLGFSVAAGRWIAALNPDTEVNSSTFSRPIAILEASADVGCVGIRQIGLDGATQNSVRGFPNYLGIAGDLLHLRVGSFDSYRLSRFNYELEQDAPQPMGTFLLFSRSALSAAERSGQPFDPQFPIFFNEVDLLYTLAARGFRCVYTPQATLLHHGGESTKQIRPKMIWESHRSLLRFFAKHSRGMVSKIALMCLTPIVLLGAWVRAKGYDVGFRA